MAIAQIANGESVQSVQDKINADIRRGNLKAEYGVKTGFSMSLFNVDNSSNQATYLQCYMIPGDFSSVRIGMPHMGGNGALSGVNAVVGVTDDIGDLTYTNTAACKKFIVPNVDGAAHNNLSFNGWKPVTWGGSGTGGATDTGDSTIDVAWSDVIDCQSTPRS
jgi:hypothetical protein